VLLLIFSDRDDVGVVKENVGGHEHRISTEAEVGRDTLGSLVLVAVRPLQQPHRGERTDEPREFTHFGYVTLPPENGFRRIKTARQPVESDALGEGAALLRVGNHRHRMIIGNKVVSVATGLELNGGAHRAEIVADMKGAGRRDAGEDAGHGRFTISG
jgi:hypothetical protein